MIIVKLRGGLGNQMFQYAAGRSLALRHQTKLKLDRSTYSQKLLRWIKSNTLRHYSLNVFNLQAEFAARHEIPRRLKEIPFNHSKNLENLVRAPDDVCLNGYWQSEDYFKEIEEIIRRDFAFKSILEGVNQELAAEIVQTESVSIHIRRADYVTNRRTNRFHGTCSPDYYHNCIRIIENEISHPHFFIFGDDLKWARGSLEINHPTTFVEHNYRTETYFEDMRLMSLCQHNIIANSSFSWWGAWLNENPQKIVLAPQPWFKAQVSDEGIVPQSWARIPCQLL